MPRQRVLYHCTTGTGRMPTMYPSPGRDTVLSVPGTLRVGTGTPDTDEETKAQQGEGIAKAKVFSPGPGVPPSGRRRPRVSGYGARPPTVHMSPSIFGRCGAGKWRRSLSSPFSLGAGPLRQQAARACPGVTLRGGCGQEQGAHSAAAAASGQPTGWPGVGGREELTKAGRD